MVIQITSPFNHTAARERFCISEHYADVKYGRRAFSDKYLLMYSGDYRRYDKDSAATTTIIFSVLTAHGDTG